MYRSPFSLFPPPLFLPPAISAAVAMENSSVASASSEAGSTRSQEIEELERFIDSYVLEYQVQGILGDKPDGDVDLDNDGKEPQWTDDCINQRDGSWTSSQGRGSSKRDEWEHSSNGSTGSRPSSGSRPGSSSRSGSRGRNNQLKGSPKNDNRDVAFDILGTDIWAANTMDSHGGAGWDVQPEKLDFSHFHRKHFRPMPKQLPHIDRERMSKNKFAEDDGIDMNDLERFLPHLRSVFPPLPNEAEIAHTKKLFRRRRNDRRRQQRPHSGGGGGGGGGKNQPQQIQQQFPQQHWDQTQQQPPNQQEFNLTDQGDNRNHNVGRPPRQHQGGHAGPRQGGPSHHGYSHNRRWHHNQGGQGHEQTNAAGDKETSPKTTKDKQTEIVRVSDEHIQPPQDCNHRSPNESPNSAPTPSATALPDLTVNKESLSMLPSMKVSDGQAEQPRVSLLQSSKERLRRRLDKDEVNEEETRVGPQNMYRLVDFLNSMRSNSSDVEKQLASFMEEAQSSARSEEVLAQVVGAIYSKAVSDRSFATTAAKRCDKMALFMVEGTKFRSLLLNALQRDFSRREELQQTDVERWLGFITFLCEVFCTMRSSSGQPFRVLVCPIYTCLREVRMQTRWKRRAASASRLRNLVSCFSTRRGLDCRHHIEVWLEVQTVKTHSVPVKKCVTPGYVPISWSRFFVGRHRNHAG
uniref:Cap binding complex dependent translation initiation factor n=1 Tax=Poecilia reticulata TaxID=8081 RepID=A0A3P9PUV6_POERE